MYHSQNNHGSVVALLWFALEFFLRYYLGIFPKWRIHQIHQIHQNHKIHQIHQIRQNHQIHQYNKICQIRQWH